MLRAYQVDSDDYDLEELAKRLDAYRRGKLFNPIFPDRLRFQPKFAYYMCMEVTGIDLDSISIQKESIFFRARTFEAIIPGYEPSNDPMDFFVRTTPEGWWESEYKRWNLLGREGLPPQLRLDDWLEDTLGQIEGRSEYAQEALIAKAHNANREVYFAVKEMFN